MQVVAPSAEVLLAFGAGPDARRLPGGQGTSWLSGHLVLKPGDGPAHGWWGTTLRDTPLEGVRVPRPVASRDGAWVVRGWTATSFVEGAEPDLSRPGAVIGIVEAGRLLHSAVAGVSRPAFLDARDDPWARADRVAWGERSVEFVPRLAGLAGRLSAQPDPPGTRQLVHGDLTRNVLVAPGSEPAVIDMSPYWRPSSYAEGVVIADVLCHHGAAGAIVQAARVPVSAVARALLFRVATTNELTKDAANRIDLEDEARRYERAASLIGI